LVQLGWAELVGLSRAVLNTRLRPFRIILFGKLFRSVFIEFQNVAQAADVDTIHSLHVEVIMDNKNNFMDNRTLIAVVLVGVLFVGWQNYLKSKYGSATPSQNAATTAADGSKATTGTGDGSVTATAPQMAANPTPAGPAQEEKTLKYENANIAFEVSSKGMGLKGLTLKNHTDREHKPMKLGQSLQHSLYQLNVLGSSEPLDFNVIQKNENEFEGVATAGTAQIKRNIRINPETEAIENTVVVENMDPQFAGLSVLIPETAIEGGSHSFLTPSFEHQEFIVLHSGKEERVNSTSSKEAIQATYPAAGLVGISSQYFTSALVDKSEIIPEAKVSGGKDAKELLAQMQYKPASGKNTMELKWISYSGGKSYSILEKIDKDLGKVVDLGFFAAIGRVLLMVLKWLFSIFGNWGVAIILLTLLVRILVLPLNITTFRSTKKMQKLQPLMTSLRERYKDDPQALNREMMGIWKEHKVNPMGGCLPMLLQLPIFFALYRVLGQSIELYQAPFFGWIHDLSLKDPFYVLPVLMAICMYFQQKMTPTTMDPTQAKIMQFLPLIFAFMMISLPSGLTLYIFINTLSGIILQRMFMRDRSTAITAKAAKA
jgi:YidC/Oxa1 family membrane protein insertase